MTAFGGSPAKVGGIAKKYYLRAVLKHKKMQDEKILAHLQKLGG